MIDLGHAQALLKRSLVGNPTWPGLARDLLGECHQMLAALLAERRPDRWVVVFGHAHVCEAYYREQALAECAAVRLDSARIMPMMALEAWPE